MAVCLERSGAELDGMAWRGVESGVEWKGAGAAAGLD